MNRLQMIEQMLEKNPDDVFMHYALAMELSGAGEQAAATEKLEWIRSRYPDYLPLYYQLAGLYGSAGRIAEAEAVYREGMDLAAAQGDRKTGNELRSAMEELIY